MSKAKSLDVYDVLHAIFYFADKGNENESYKPSTSELMKLLKVTDRTLRRYKQDGRLKADPTLKGVNGQDVFTLEDVSLFLENLLSEYEERHGINLYEDTLKD